MFAKNARKSTLIFRLHFFVVSRQILGHPRVDHENPDCGRRSHLPVVDPAHSGGGRGHSLTMVNDGEEAWQQLLASPEPSMSACSTS